MVEKKKAVDEALLGLAKDQRVEMVAEWHRTLEAVGIGLARAVEKGWVFAAEDFAAPDPADWRRYAKICYLLAQLKILEHDLDYQASTKPMLPLWCNQCHEGQPSPDRNWLTVECVDHNTAPSVAARIGKTFWGLR